MKKFLALVLTLIMALSLATVAFADPATTPVATITAPDNGHKYAAYQIFIGDISAGNVLANIEWGDGITAEGQEAIGIEFAKRANPGADSVTKFTAAEIAVAITDDNVAEFAKLVAPYLQNPVDITADINKHTADTILDKPHYGVEVTPGYYLVKDSETVTGHDAATNFILHVVGNVTLNPKSSVPKVDKMQSTTESGYTHDVVDVNINDMVYYELTGTMPNTLHDYETYKYVFHDTLSAGLTYNDGSVVVTIDGKEVKTGYIVEYIGTDNTLTISFANIRAAKDASDAVITVTKNSQVVVHYNATLNEKAVIGGDGNPNEVYLEFSNDPTWNGKGKEPTGETPVYKVVAFTFQINVDKQDNIDQTKHLADAQFVLWNHDMTKVVVLDADNKVTGWASHFVGDKCKDAHAAGIDLGTIVKSDADGRFNFIGLDAGDYFLEEIKAPAGYNKLSAPVEIKIIATYEQNKLTGLKADAGDVMVNGDVANGSVSIIVRNSPGNTLPSTGGIGTTIFYVVGAVLMVGAAVLLVTKKRMNAM